MKLGFIGLGIMGAPMALRLAAAGHSVAVHTRSALRPEVSAAGALACASAREVRGAGRHRLHDAARHALQALELMAAHPVAPDQATP